jgi:hypothetical protein
MRHIEEQLRLFQVRYVYHRDAKITLTANRLAPFLTDRHIADLDLLDNITPTKEEVEIAKGKALRFLPAGVKKYIDILAYAFISLWLSYLLPKVLKVLHRPPWNAGKWIAFGAPLVAGIVALVCYLCRYHSDQAKGRREIERRYQSWLKRSPRVG